MVSEDRFLFYLVCVIRMYVFYVVLVWKELVISKIFVVEFLYFIFRKMVFLVFCLYCIFFGIIYYGVRSLRISVFGKVVFLFG